MPHLKKGMALASIAAVLLLSACGAAVPKEPGLLDSQAADYPEAVALYKQSCLSCHAVNLQGRVGPGLQQAGSKFTESELVALISDGKGGMPAFKKSMTQEEIETLAQWLAQQK